MSSNRPPRDLNSLLTDIRVPSDIDRHPWAKSFREHLRKLQQPEVEALLDFAIVANVLRVKGEEIRVSKWRTDDINRERVELLQMVGNSFFSENSETPIALSNQVLREELKEALDNVKKESDNKDIEEAFDLVWQARCDYKVWKGGLDKAYNAYLATRPSQPLTAVLLSLLWKDTCRIFFHDCQVWEKIKENISQYYFSHFLSFIEKKYNIIRGK